MAPNAPLSDPLSRALDDAIAGRRHALFDLLARGSHLPGPRINEALADAFAQACRAHGERGEGVALALARLTADEAPGATPLEFLPVCGVLALASRGAAEEAARGRVVQELHAHADDLRFRVREAVIAGLGRVGAVAGDTLVQDVAGWMDGYFHAAAALTALGREPWLAQVHDAAGAIARLGEGFALADAASRAAARYPGRKALVDALGRVPVAMAVRFGVPVFDALVGWASTRDPELRELVTGLLDDKRLAARFGGEVGRVRRALEATRAPARNPDHDFGPSRDRSGARRRRGR